jgi:RNA-directed DNA polymerase
MKENIAQSHMHPTQSGNRMSQGLDGVREAAKERRQERFTSLLHHLNVDLLHDSFYALQRKASPGVDGMTWQRYETGIEDRLFPSHRDLQYVVQLRQREGNGRRHATANLPP